MHGQTGLHGLSQELAKIHRETLTSCAEKYTHKIGEADQVDSDADLQLRIHS